MDIDKFIQILDNSDIIYKVLENPSLEEKMYKILLTKNGVSIKFIFNYLGRLINIEYPDVEYITFTGVP